MKIARVSDSSGQIHYIEPIDEKSGNLLTGSIADGFARTDNRISYEHAIAPLDPTCILCVGLNYLKHAEETGAKIPEKPMIFLKSPNTLLNPGAPIQIPTFLESTQVDYECELAIVIGKRTKNVSVESALEHVFGYTIANDVSARDWQWDWGQGQFCQGKSFDTFCPLGPHIVTADEIPDPQTLDLQTRVNGETRQDSNTSDMIFSVAEIVAFLSGSKTLLPGTVILTGTPSGVGGGFKPPKYLNVGDTVELSIEKIGSLQNPVEAEPS